MSDPLIPVEPVLEVVSRLDVDVQTVHDIIKSMIGEHDILDERIQSLLDRSSRLKVTISAMLDELPVTNGGEVLSSIAFIMRARCDEVIIERDAITSTIQSLIGLPPEEALSAATAVTGSSGRGVAHV